MCHLKNVILNVWALFRLTSPTYVQAIIQSFYTNRLSPLLLLKRQFPLDILKIEDKKRSISLCPIAITLICFGWFFGSFHNNRKSIKEIYNLTFYLISNSKVSNSCTVIAQTHPRLYMYQFTPLI